MPDNLKKGWTKVAFGDVVRLSRERSRDPLSDGFERYIGLEHLDPEDLKIRRWGNVEDGTTFTSVFRAGQVLFGKRRSYQKKLAVPDFDGVCSGDIYVLEPKNEHLLPELLPFICQTDSFFDHAVGTSAGSLSPRTNWKSLAEYEFALPPLDEQRRIAEVLEANINLIESLIIQFNTLEKLKLSLRSLLLSHYDDSMCLLSEIARFRSGNGITVSQLPKEKNPEYPVPVFGGNGIAGYTKTPMDLVPVPTVVIGRVGEYCGAIYIAREPAWVSDNALFMSELHKSINEDYLAICLSLSGLSLLRSGGAQPLVNQKIVGNLMIPLPSIKVQQKIVNQDKKIVICQDATARKIAKTKKLSNKLLTSMGIMQ